MSKLAIEGVQTSQEKVNHNHQILFDHMQTLVGWLNNLLKKRSHQIKIFPKDLTDGILFAEVYEVLTGKTLKVDPKPKFDVQKMGNVNVVLKAFEDDGVKVDLFEIFATETNKTI